MKRKLFLMTTAALTVAACVFLLPSCDRTIETKSTTNQGPAGKTEKTETTVQHPDGTVTVDKETHSTTPQ